MVVLESLNPPRLPSGSLPRGIPMLLVGGGFFGSSTAVLLLEEELGAWMGFSGRLGIGSEAGQDGCGKVWGVQFGGGIKNSQGIGKPLCKKSGGFAALAIEFTQSEDEKDEVSMGSTGDSATDGGGRVSIEYEGIGLGSIEEDEASS